MMFFILVINYLSKYLSIKAKKYHPRLSYVRVSTT